MNDKCGITEYCEMRTGDICTLGSPCPHQEPLTNEEWMKSLDTEELVDHLYDWRKDGSSVERQMWLDKHKERIKMQIRGWLKAKHK